MLKRTIAGAGLIALLIFAVYFGGWVFALLFMGTICLCLSEMLHALAVAGHRPIAWPTWACMALSIPCFMLSSNSVLIPLVAGTCIVITGLVMFRSNPRLEDVLTSIMPVFAVVLPGMCMLSFLNISQKGVQVMMLSLAFGVPTMGDTLAYFVGSRVGKTKLIPSVSPNKTVAGAVAGLIGSVLFSLIVYAFGFWCMDSMPPLWHYLTVGLLGGFVGQLGDLFASLVKRHCGIKDYSSLIPGHGGMMDRLDSVLMASIVVYGYALFTGLI